MISRENVAVMSREMETENIKDMGEESSREMKTEKVEEVKRTTEKEEIVDSTTGCSGAAEPEMSWR